MKSLTDRITGLRFSREENLCKEECIFITLSGNSSSVAYTKKQAITLSKFLQEASNKVKNWSKELK